MDIIIIALLIVVVLGVAYQILTSPNKQITRRGGRPIFVDTSVLIDGRILSIAQSGFIGDILVIPRSVIGELQFLADNADHDKRSRARHGLDVVKELQNTENISVEIFQDGSKAEEGVDERLLKLAKNQSGSICTIDFNLNKVAQVENIPVLNVNELAQMLRMAYLPGEKMLLELVQKGQDSHQAVGYLTDGTMVVVENANKRIGEKAEIEFIRSLQTAAGKMMFAKLVPSDGGDIAKVKKPAGRVQANRNNVKKQPQNNQTKKPGNQKPKMSSSAQNEALLIELVNQQK